jgi:hypothetical protein
MVTNPHQDDLGSNGQRRGSRFLRNGLAAAASAILLCAALLAQPLVVGAATPPDAVPVIAAVGDIACKNPPARNRSVCQYDDVSASIAARNYDRFLVLGDNQYEYGRYVDFVQNYDVYFGRLLDISSPVAGNHDWGVPQAAGYLRYFGDRVPGYWYSYELGSWHVIALDSTVCGAGGVNCLDGSPQYEWLQKDLTAHEATCTLAYWHHPRWTWFKYQNADWNDDYEQRRTEPLWNLLYRRGADVVLTGHDHNYSRWMPADVRGRFDPVRGITQYTIGTGGRNLNGFGNFHTRPETFVRGQADAFGFLQMRLEPGGWDARWISARGQPSYVDESTGSCH